MSLDTSNSNVDKSWIVCDKEASDHANVVVESRSPEQDETSLLKENDNGDVHVRESTVGEYAFKPESIQDENISTTDNHDTSCKTLIRADENSVDPDSLPLVSVEEPVVPDHDGANKSDSSQTRFSDSDIDVVVPDHDGANKSDSSQTRFSDSDIDVVASKVEQEMVDSDGPNNSENPVMHEATREGGENCCKGLQDLTQDEVILRKAGNPESLSCKMEDTSLVGNVGGIQDTFSSLATESAQVASSSGKGAFDIDLNDEVYHEGVDCLKTPFSSIVASGTPNGNVTVSVEGSSYSSKQRQNLLEIDLNMTDGGLDGAADIVLTDQIPSSSCLISGESSIEVDSRRAGRQNFDLNSVGVNDDSLSSDGILGRSCHHYLHNPPPAAASSSSRQPLSTNIDLNENLCVVNDTYDHQTHRGDLSSHNMNSCGELKRDSRVICIMGRRVEINGEDVTPSQSVFPNGQSGISFMDSSLPEHVGFEGLQHAVASIPQLYGSTVFPMGPSTSLSAMCERGYIPYMVDSRGVHVAPQIIGSPMAFPHAYSTQPFPMSVNSTPFNMNGVGSVKASFDLNSSSTMVGGWTGELGGWTSEQNHLEESMGSTSQCLSSGLGMKRKEPDGALELYPCNYKQQQLWR